MASVKDLTSVFSKIDFASAVFAKSVAAAMTTDNTDDVGVFKNIVFSYQTSCWLPDLTSALWRCSLSAKQQRPTAALVCLWTTKTPQRLNNISAARLDKFYAAFVASMTTETTMMIPVATDDPEFVTFEASQPIKWSQVTEARETSCIFLTSSPAAQISAVTNAKVTAAYCNSMDTYGLPESLLSLSFFTIFV